MTTRHRSSWTARALLGGFFVSVIAAVACGARTQLPIGQRVEEDAGIDRHVKDATPDVPPDVEPDVVTVNCEEAGITFVYVMTSQNNLYAFYPPDLSFTLIGTIDCPDPGFTPFSMAVDRAGTAYVLFNDGTLFKVSTKDASCEPTGFTTNQENFGTLFGMGFSSNKNDPGETLYVADQTVDAGSSGTLASIDPSDFTLSPIGAFSMDIGSVELTGTGDSRLFAFGPEQMGPSHLAEVEKTSGAILSDTLVDLPVPITAWAFAFWGGDFYFFTSGGGPSTVSKYTPGGSTTPPEVQTLEDTIVGAGVSTCSPH